MIFLHTNTFIMPYQIQCTLIATENIVIEIHKLIIYSNDQMKAHHIRRNVVYQNDPKHLK